MRACVFAFFGIKQNRTKLISDADTSDRAAAVSDVVGSGAACIRYRSTARVPVAPPTVRFRVVIKCEKRVRHVSPLRFVHLARLPPPYHRALSQSSARPCGRAKTDH